LKKRNECRESFLKRRTQRARPLIVSAVSHDEGWEGLSPIKRGYHRQNPSLAARKKIEFSGRNAVQTMIHNTKGLRHISARSNGDQRAEAPAERSLTRKKDLALRIEKGKMGKRERKTIYKEKLNAEQRGSRNEARGDHPKCVRRLFHLVETSTLKSSKKAGGVALLSEPYQMESTTPQKRPTTKDKEKQ